MSPSVEEVKDLKELSVDNPPEVVTVRRRIDLSGPKKAAVLCLSIGEEAATALLRQLDESEVHLISKELALLPDVKSEMTDAVLEEFHGLLSARNYVMMGGFDFARRLLEKTFGPENAKRMTAKVLHSLGAPANFEGLQKTDPQQLAKLFQSEHPQIIAVVLAHLDSAASSTVLQNLPEAQRADVVMRLATLQTVSQDVVKRIAHVLNQKLAGVSNVTGASNVGGIRAVADIFNRLDRETTRLMLERIEEENPDLSVEIRNLMVTFEDILMIDDIGIREILQRVDKKVLSLALKGTVKELQDRFFLNMSSRAVEMMKEEMEFMGQIKVKEVTAAQREIVEILRQLDEQGVINLSGEGGEDEYVI